MLYLISFEYLCLYHFSDEHSPEKFTTIENERRRSRLNSPADDDEEMLNNFPSDPDYGEWSP
jgi:hypothetical protein